MKQPTIAIVDYGVGNLESVLNACKRFTPHVSITEEAETISRADAIILPGVGSFGAGIQGLSIRGLIPTIKTAALNGVPILGICLGAQILFSKGYEFGTWEGLHLIPGDVVPFPELPQEVRLPHIGWNEVKPVRPTQGTILENIPERATMYFVHSFILKPSDSDSILASSSYGGAEFPSVVRHGNIYGCQFHPEKSAELGIRIVENFIHLISTR